MYQFQREEICPLYWISFLGWGPYYPGYYFSSRTPEYPRTDCYRQEQWTPQAKELYDLLILTYSTNQGVLADLRALKTSSGLSDEDWNDLLQYTTQVCCVPQPVYSSRIDGLRYSATWSTIGLLASPRSSPVYLQTSSRLLYPNPPTPQQPLIYGKVSVNLRYRTCMH